MLRRGSISLADAHPETAAWWHPDLNGDLTAHDVSRQSNQKAWWRCDKGHEWKQVIFQRTRAAACPYCSGDRPSSDYCLASERPDVASQWHPTRNGDFTPFDFTPRSHHKAWWRCDKGHEWQARIGSRSEGRACPECGKWKSYDPNKNLSAAYPEVAADWHPSKNGELQPSDVRAHSTSRRIWWLCPRGHEKQTTVDQRVKRGCVECNTYEKSVAVLKPDLLSEWHSEKNGELAPTEIAASSGRKVWWRCTRNQNHEWQATPSNRPKSGCPVCARRGLARQADSFALAHPEIAAEWHPDLNPADASPSDITARYSVAFWWLCPEGHSYLESPRNRAAGRRCPTCFPTKARNEPRPPQPVKAAEPRICLADSHPEIAAEWHPTKNNPDVSPASITARFQRSVWWVCSEGHEFRAAPNRRVDLGAGCRVCAYANGSLRRQALSPVLVEVCPELAAEWDVDLNDRELESITCKSTYVAWWSCAVEHHEPWQASVFNRVKGGSPCPDCAGRRRHGFLSEMRPDLFAEIDRDRNADVDLAVLRTGSNATIWWVCAKGHSYDAQVAVRNRGSQCPYCSGRRLSPERVLSATHPRLASEWHPTKNGDLHPDGVLPTSRKPVWWKCAAGHEWQTGVWGRANADSPCPFCSGYHRPHGESLASGFPDVAAEWHPTKNGDLRPEAVTAGMKANIWWRCAEGHEWQARLSSRTTQGNGCPTCAGFGGRLGTLASATPHMLAEWHPTKNGDLTPDAISAASGRRVWWKCSKGHEWESSPGYRRHSNSNGCPYCYGKLVPPEDSLLTQHPTIAVEWHLTKNERGPETVYPDSHIRVWWQCSACGHDWMTAPRVRLNGGGCPRCESLASRCPEVMKEWDYDRNDLDPTTINPNSAYKVWWVCSTDNSHSWQATPGNRISRKSGCPYCMPGWTAQKLLKHLCDVGATANYSYEQWLKIFEDCLVLYSQGAARILAEAILRGVLIDIELDLFLKGDLKVTPEHVLSHPRMKDVLFRQSIPSKTRKAIFKRDGHACQLCGTTDNLSIDHFVPIAVGGTNDDDDNYWTLCRPCNSKKSAGIPDDDLIGRWQATGRELPHCFYLLDPNREDGKNARSTDLQGNPAHT